MKNVPPRKKLIEVALPLEKINKESAREKSIRHGHPSTLHLWWARRPLAACRAVLFAQLVDDPDSDPAYKHMDPETRDQLAGSKRQRLFDLIEELVCWENANNADVLNRARKEIARCIASRKIETGELAKSTIIFGPDEGKKNEKGEYSDQRITAHEMEQMFCRPEVVDYFLSKYAPPVLDPFAGGGSIPLEAQRLGLRAVASDLNPVAVLINKALVEIPPKFADLPPVHPTTDKKLAAQWPGARGLAEDVRHYGQWMREQAEKRIGTFYPKVKITKKTAENRPDLEQYVGQELTVIAWIWARTVPSSDPSYEKCEVPLVSSYWLSKKKDKEAWVEPIVEGKEIRFEVRVGKATKEQREINDAGTKLSRGCKFRCLLSKQPIPEDHVKSKAMEGQMGAKLMAVVCEGVRGRVYLSPTPEQEKIAESIQIDSNRLEGIQAAIADDKRALWCVLYGLNTFDKLFTNRQLLALTTFSDLVGEARQKVLDDMKGRKVQNRDAKQYADAVATYLAFAVSKCSDYWGSIATWSNGEFIRGTFARQALPMTWDFAECSPFSDSTGNWSSMQNWIIGALESLPSMGCIDNTASQADATSKNVYHGEVISTDPPYYDNIGYADLSDYFYVWLRRSLQKMYPELLSTLVTPKSSELIASPYRHGGSRAKAAAFFESGLGEAIQCWAKNSSQEYPTTIYYAFKQAETEVGGVASTGWETFLAGVIEAGFSITGTWPIRTERGVRSVAIGTNALASSIVLSCVPRPAGVKTATQREFTNQLKVELPEALRKLQSGSIAPVDLAQAAIGPGMAIFSRYKNVVGADGTPLSVRSALQMINRQLDEVLAEQEGEFDVETRWAIAWFEQFGSDAGPFGVAETLSKAKNASVAGLVEAGVAVSKGGDVQLVDRESLSKDWDPKSDKRLTDWESLQHLIFMYENHGELGAARLMARLSGEALDRCLDLAYRLYSVCERKKWASEAIHYNGIVQVWTELIGKSRKVQDETQGELF